MKKAIITILICIGVLCLLNSCGTAWKVKQCRKWNICQTDSTGTKDSTVSVVHDTVAYTQPDTAYMTMWLECNELNQVVVKQSEQINAKYIDLQKRYENGKLIVTVYKQAEPVRFICRETFRFKSEYVRKSVPVKFMSWWQKLFMWFGIGSAVCLLFRLILWLLRKVVNIGNLL